MAMLEVEIDIDAPAYNGLTLGEVQLEDYTRTERLTATMDGTTFLLTLSWNQRSATWQISIFTSQEEPIRLGVLAAVNAPIFRAVQDSRLPKGQIWIQDIEGGSAEAGREDLGKRVRIFYLPAADMLEVVA